MIYSLKPHPLKFHLTIGIFLIFNLIISVGCGKHVVIYDESRKTKLEEGRMYKDRYIGKWISYYDNGQIKRVCRIDWKSRNKGRSTSYFESGQIMNIRKYKHGEVLRTYIYHENGNLSFYIESVYAGVNFGRFERYYENGVLMEQGIMDTSCIAYSKIGNELEKVPSAFCSCKWGEWHEFYADGKVKSKGSYQNLRIETFDSTNKLIYVYPKIGPWIYIDSLSGDTIFKTYYPDSLEIEGR